ncbi:MAG: hypothetical protein LBQ26_00660 [Holosporales bacterium]|jgi:septal ring factor EnvC (AmiA/AmiB activator)|nr:hypothetical protein [Holosporales bacterium]
MKSKLLSKGCLLLCVLMGVSANSCYGMRGRFDQTQARITQQQAELVDRQNSEIISLRTQIETLETEKDTLQGQLAERNQLIEQLQLNRTDLNQNIQSLTMRMEDANAQLAARRSVVTWLKDTPFPIAAISFSAIGAGVGLLIYQLFSKNDPLATPERSYGEPSKRRD